MAADIQQPPTERREALAEGGSWEDRRVAVRIIQQKKYTDSYVLRGPRPKGGVYSSHVDESSYCSLQGTWGQDTLRPVTIKQILDAQQPHPDADFKIDEIEISQVLRPSSKCDGGMVWANVRTEDYVRGPNPQRLDTNHQHNLQAR